MKNPERISARFKLRGRVQGVGCRAQVEKRMHALAEEFQEAISGWVRNLPGGEVEVVVAASASMIDRIQSLLSSGLRFPVRVDSVDRELIQDHEIIANNESFRVLR